jgi:hypothetical protein
LGKISDNPWLQALPSLKEINLQGNPMKNFPLSLVSSSSIKCGIPADVEIVDDIAYAARLERNPDPSLLEWVKKEKLEEVKRENKR